MNSFNHTKQIKTLTKLEFITYCDRYLKNKPYYLNYYTKDNLEGYISFIETNGDIFCIGHDLYNEFKSIAITKEMITNICKQHHIPVVNWRKAINHHYFTHHSITKLLQIFNCNSVSSLYQLIYSSYLLADYEISRSICSMLPKELKEESFLYLAPEFHQYDTYNIAKDIFSWLDLKPSEIQVQLEDVLYTDPELKGNRLNIWRKGIIDEINQIITIIKNSFSLRHCLSVLKYYSKQNYWDQLDFEVLNDKIAIIQKGTSNSFLTISNK